MDLKTYTTGIQHIGIPTNDIEKTIAFYQKLGFEIALQTVNEEADEKVAFLELETLVIETYENKAAKMESGAIDHVAINVKDIEEVYRYIEAEKMNTTKDTIHFLPFWDNGVRFFTIEGPNKEKVEFTIKGSFICSNRITSFFTYSVAVAVKPAITGLLPVI